MVARAGWKPVLYVDMLIYSQFELKKVLKMFQLLQVQGKLYRIYGPHVYVNVEPNPKYLFNDGTYWQPTDIPVGVFK